MSEVTRAARRHVLCPRCGYDVHGAVDAWQTSCTLAHQCAECGLRFEWGDLLNSSRRRPAWSVEHTLLRRHVPIKTLWTLAMMLRPWSFWSRLRLAHEVRYGRLAVFLGLFVLLAYALFALLQATRVASDCRRLNLPLERTLLCAAYTAALPLSSDPPDIYSVILTSAAPPGAAPGTPAIAPMTIQSWQLAGATIPDPPATYLWPYTGEWDPDALLLAMMTRRFDTGMGGSVAHGLIVWAFVVLLCLTTLLGFVLLPASLRRARVRPRHLVRITLYALVLPALLLTYAVVRQNTAGYGPRQSTVALCEELWLVVRITPLLLLAWWWCAVARYLQLAHAAGVAVAMVVLGVLIGPVLVLLAWYALTLA